MEKITISKDLFDDILRNAHDLSSWGIMAAECLITAIKETLPDKKVEKMLKTLEKFMIDENEILDRVLGETKEHKIA